MKKLSTKNLALIITAAIVAVVLIIAAVAFVVHAVTNDIFFDYSTANLSDYVSLDKYTGFELNVDIAEPRYEQDIATSKINMLCEDKPEKIWIDDSKGSWSINPGDVVYIWYRGYVIVDGEEIWLDSMTNIRDVQSSKHESSGIEIGSNNSTMASGFELALVDKVTGDFDDFEILKEGSVARGSVAYISYKKDGKEVKQQRVDLSDETIDEKYGEGFKMHLVSKTIGEKKNYPTKLNGADVIYENLTVDIVTNNEDKGLKVEGSYFPYNHGDATLRNLDAVYYVYFDKIDRYYKEAPVFDDDYLKKKIEGKDIVITLEELDKYDGTTLVEKYDNYARELMEKIYKSEYESAACSAIWEYYWTNAKFDKKALPVSKVDEVYYELAYKLYDLYETNGGVIYNDYYGSQQYETIDKYANAYLGINYTSEYYEYGDEAWKFMLLDQAEDLVKERILVFYILRDAKAIPGDADFNERLEEIKQEYVDQYLEEYIEEWFAAKGGSKDDYSDEEWKQFEKERSEDLIDYYGEEKFKEEIYYELLSEKMVEWSDPENGNIKINILDENRNNYPKDK